MLHVVQHDRGAVIYGGAKGYLVSINVHRKDDHHPSCPAITRHARLDRASSLFVHRKGGLGGETMGFVGFIHGSGLFSGETGDCRSSRQ